MKLSNKHRRALESIHHHLERAEKFLKREDVAGIAIKQIAQTAQVIVLGIKSAATFIL